MDKPKPGDVVRFRNDVDGTLCTFTFSENNELGEPPIYNFTNDEGVGIIESTHANTDAAAATGMVTQIIDVHNSTITVNVNTDAGGGLSTITVNTAGNKSTITVNAGSVAVEITPEHGGTEVQDVETMNKDN